MKYSTTKGQQKEDVLLINDLQSVCPYTAPIPFQGNVGQVQIMRMPCSTLCPHAYKTKTNYTITCGHDAQNFPLSADEKTGDSSVLVSI